MTAELQSRLEEIAATFSGQLGVAIDADVVFPTASVIKVPVLVAVLREVEAGGLDLARRVELTAEDRVGGSGILKVLQPGLAMSLEDVLVLMIALSDNTATNLAIDLLGGVDAVNTAMSDLGLGTIMLHNRVDFELIGDDASGFGTATPADLARLMLLIADGRCFSPFVSETAERILGTQQYLDQALRYVHTAPYAAELGITPSLSFASKTGFISGVRVDAGIVRFAGGGGYAYAVMNRGSRDLSFLPEAEGVVVNGLVGRLLTTSWWPADAGPAPVSASAYLTGE
jgi:beta-lactamase class A